MISGILLWLCGFAVGAIVGFRVIVAAFAHQAKKDKKLRDWINSQ